MRNLFRILCLLICFALLGSFFSFPQTAASENTGTSNPSPSIRVRLRRLALTDRADLTLTGSWLVTGGNGTVLWLSSGGSVILQLRNGQLVFFYQGMSAALGKTVFLQRQTAGNNTASSAIRIGSQSGKYPGDLLFRITDGQLDPVLTLSLEDYVQGVVPYEMNERFPLEALKAQAVCARTYALSRVSTQRDYDVVDTTNDQVFRGLEETNTNTARAVTETAGLVITADGKLAQGYYSASNGGQTELPSHVWGGKDPSSCYAVTDDPYDLENPESMTRTAELRRDGSGLGNAFLTLIRNAVLAEPEMKDYLQDADAFRLDRIENVQLTEPRFSAPSRLMTRMEITVSVSGKKLLREPAALTPAPRDDPDSEELLLFSTPVPTDEPLSGSESSVSDTNQEINNEYSTPSPTPSPEISDFLNAGTYTVSLNLFPDVLYTLGLSISGAGNEIVTVTETGSGFRLTAGRFGHGVGMSQRGAQWMASRYGKTAEEILSFYFPGMVLKQVAYGIPPVAEADPLLAATPGPAATPTPRPTLMPVTAEALPEGAYLASVENIEDDSSLNLRSEPSAAGEILMRLYKHQRLIVLEDSEIPGWAHVKTDSAEGYVMTSFLEKMP